MPQNDDTYTLKDFLAGLYQCLDGETVAKQAEVDESLQVAEALLFQNGAIREERGKMMKVMARHQISEQVVKVQVPLWFIGDHQLHYDTRLVDQVQETTSSTSTIFQKIPQGYLRIATNVLRNDGTRAVNTYIPNGSPVVKTIETGETYRGVAFVVNDWYATAYKPIRIDGRISGMLYVGVKEPLSVIEGHYFNDYHREVIGILSRLFQKSDSKDNSVISELIHLLYRQETQLEGNKLFQFGLRQLIILLMQASSRGKAVQNQQDKDLHLYERLNYISQYIRFNLDKELNMQHLAEKAHMSQSTFFRAFKSSFGMTPTDYINRERVLKAYQLLKNSDKSVTDVCFEVGYNSTSYFIRQFKMYHGITPKQFKKEIAEK